MEKRGSISGVVMLDLDWKNDRLIVLQEDDHILRRFGQADVVKIAKGMQFETHRNAGADEVWVLLDGEAKLQLTDRRAESPTVDHSIEIVLAGDSPQAVMIPFGVFAQISGEREGTLLRITTHADQLFPDDTVFSQIEKG